MGTSGPKVFDSDIAADVRSEYRDLVAEGLDGVAVTDRLLDRYHIEAEDPDEGPDFWIGLAVAQFEVGRLEDRVRDRALALIDDGTDVARFHPEDRTARLRVLERVRLQLTGPQKTPTRIRRRPKSICPYKVGDVLEVALRDGHRILLCVQGIRQDRGGDYARVVVLDWHDSERTPSLRRLRRHRLTKSPMPHPLAEANLSPKAPHQYNLALGFLLVASDKRDHLRLEESVRKIGRLNRRAPTVKAQASQIVLPWTDLERWFLDGRVRSTPVKRSEM